MPHANWLLKKISTGEFLKDYDESLGNCTWTTIPLEAKHYQTENGPGGVNDDIESWGETPGTNFVGQNPPPR